MHVTNKLIIYTYKRLGLLVNLPGKSKQRQAETNANKEQKNKVRIIIIVDF